MDLIERQAAIDAIKTSRFLVDAMEKVIKLPSAQPERKNIDWDTIEYLSEIRTKFSRFDEFERRYYEALSNAIDFLRGEET